MKVGKTENINCYFTIIEREQKIWKWKTQ